jgi:hypothetical protein
VEGAVRGRWTCRLLPCAAEYSSEHDRRCVGMEIERRQEHECMRLCLRDRHFGRDLSRRLQVFVLERALGTWDSASVDGKYPHSSDSGPR